MDLATKTSYQLHEFFDGTRCPATLFNAVTWFDLERTSYLSYARANDVEEHERAMARRAASGEKPVKRKPTIETFEYSPMVELLANLFEQLQVNTHYTATHGSKAAKKTPKITRWPRPTTAAQKVKRAAARAAMKRAEEVVVFSDEPYGLDSPYVRYSKLPASAGTGPPRQLDKPKNPKRGMRQPGQADGE